MLIWWPGHAKSELGRQHGEASDDVVHMRARVRSRRKRRGDEARGVATWWLHRILIFLFSFFFPFHINIYSKILEKFLNFFLVYYDIL